MRKNGEFVNCIICNKSFYLPKYRLKADKKYMCSRSCKGKYQSIKNFKKAAQPFNKPWQVLIYQWYVIEKISIREITKKLKVSNRLVPHALKYLNIPQRSVHDRIALQWEGNPERRENYSKMMSKMRAGQMPWNKGLTKKTNVSIKRQSEWMEGANNPMHGKFGKAHHLYKNGFSASHNRAWGHSKYKNWREAVYKRDNYTCQECGDKKGGNLEAHHIKSWADFPKLRYILSNGITLCSKCHHIVHKNISL